MQGSSCGVRRPSSCRLGASGAFLPTPRLRRRARPSPQGLVRATSRPLTAAASRALEHDPDRWEHHRQGRHRPGRRGQSGADTALCTAAQRCLPPGHPRQAAAIQTRGEKHRRARARPALARRPLVRECRDSHAAVAPRSPRSTTSRSPRAARRARAITPSARPSITKTARRPTRRRGGAAGTVAGGRAHAGQLPALGRKLGAEIRGPLGEPGGASLSKAARAAGGAPRCDGQAPERAAAAVCALTAVRPALITAQRPRRQRAAAAARRAVSGGGSGGGAGRDGAFRLRKAKTPAVRPTIALRPRHPVASTPASAAAHPRLRRRLSRRLPLRLRRASAAASRSASPHRLRRTSGRWA